MGFMDFLHAHSDLRTKKNDRRLAQQESAAKVNSMSEADRLAWEKHLLEKAKFDESVKQDMYIHGVQSRLLDHFVRTGADIEYKGLTGRYHRVPPTATGTALPPAASASNMPSAPPFRQIMPYIKGDNIVLGVSERGIVQGTISDWLSTLIIGMPGYGKSTLLHFIIAQMLLLRSQFVVLDPHASLSELRGMLPYTNDVGKCLAAASIVADELEQRKERFAANGGKCVDGHFMLVVDELPALIDREQQSRSSVLSDTLRHIVTEGRKFNMYAVVVGQSLPASILPTITRDNMSSRYVFNCLPRHAQMAGLDTQTINTMLPLLDGQVGKCIVSPARMRPFLAAIPETNVSDLQYVIGRTGYKPGNFSASSQSRLLPSPGQSETRKHGNALPYGVTAEQIARIKSLQRQGYPLREIAKAVGLSGRRYGQFQEACRYLGIREGAR